MASNFDKFLLGTGKREHGRKSAIAKLVPARAFRRAALSTRCNLFAVSRLIFVRSSFSRVLRSKFSDSRNWISLVLTCPFTSSIPRFVKPPERLSETRSRERRRQRLRTRAGPRRNLSRHLAPAFRSVSGSLKGRLVVVTRCPSAASAANN